MQLAQKGIIADQQYYHHNPELQDLDGMTVGMYLAKNGIIPPKCWYTNDKIQNKNNQTVDYFLAQNKILAHKYPITDNDKKIIEQYCKNMNIDVDYKITAEFQQNENKETVAMWLTKQYKLIPRQWIHNYNIQNKYGLTLKDLLKKYLMPIPNEYQNINKMNIFDQAYFGIIPEIGNHKSQEFNNQGYTIAMFLAWNGIDIPEQWKHNNDLINNYGQTVALIYAKYGVIPPKYWEYSPNWQEGNGKTVAMRLAQNNVIPPKQWYHNPRLKSSKNCNNMTVAMYIAQYCNQISEQHWNHNPKIKNKQKQTVAMILAQKGIIPPKQWQHKSKLQDKDGFTVAMYIAKCCKQIPPKEWQHNPNIKNSKNKTVADQLREYDIQIPQQWKENEINTKNIFIFI